MEEIEVLAPGGNQDVLREEMFGVYLIKQFCGLLLFKSPLLIYANQMLPVPTTLLPEMTQADLEQLTA